MGSDKVARLREKRAVLEKSKEDLKKKLLQKRKDLQEILGCKKGEESAAIESLRKEVSSKEAEVQKILEGLDELVP